MPDINFDAALAPLEPKNTARMLLRGVRINSDKDVVLVGVHAGENNEKMQALSDKLAAKYATELAASDAKAVRAIVNAMFVELYSKTVITGWENVCEGDGKPVKFTQSTFAAFLTSLQKVAPAIAGAGRGIENYFSRAQNFADGYAALDTEALGEE